MTRGQVRRRLSVNWWQYLALALLPLFVINAVFGQSEAILPVLAMPLFIAGVASMFLQRKLAESEIDAGPEQLVTTLGVTQALVNLGS